MLNFLRIHAAKIIIGTVLFFALSIVLLSLPSFFGSARINRQNRVTPAKLAKVNGKEINPLKLSTEFQKKGFSICRRSSF